MDVVLQCTAPYEILNPDDRVAFFDILVAPVRKLAAGEIMTGYMYKHSLENPVYKTSELVRSPPYPLTYSRPQKKKPTAIRKSKKLKIPSPRKTRTSNLTMKMLQNLTSSDLRWKPLLDHLCSHLLHFVQCSNPTRLLCPSPPT